MCGIAGWFGPNTGKDAEALVRALRHRGPDGSGVWESENAALVHTRLAILDLSDAGRQPMEFQKTEDRGQESEVVGRRFDDIVNTVALLSGRPSILGFRPTSSVLVFNGEIYNHAELRTDLEEQGEVFAGHSDTEVLLRLLVRQGAACLPKLAGMFAFAFWDEGTGAALLARDPLGIKPLYYREEGGTLCFASETRVLRMDGDMNDASAVRDFFLWGSVPEPATWNVAIRQLPAGHLLRWQNGECSIQQWHVVDNWPRRGGHALLDSIALTRSALLESMCRHLVSDVPVGIFLSGGIGV
jgi:asparagine synthase (glutamine-hydrolysing)